MRITILICLFFSVVGVKAQTVLPAGIDYIPHESFLNKFPPADSLTQKKWSFSKYTGISTSMSFFKGGNATIVSAPMGLQLNRRLNNNLYAFANVCFTPAYTTFNGTFRPLNYNTTGQQKGMFNANGVNIYSRASLGLMYVNENKTFSISGSISVENSPYSSLPYYPSDLAKPNTVVPPKR